MREKGARDRLVGRPRVFLSADFCPHGQGHGGHKSLPQRNYELGRKDTEAMNGYPHFHLYTWTEETETCTTEEGRWSQLRRIPKNIKSDLKRGKCRVFSDLYGNDCYAKIDRPR